MTTSIETELNSTTSKLETILNKPYQYGFSTPIQAETIAKGLTKNTIRLISAKKAEPFFMFQFRLRAFCRWMTMKEAHWAQTNYLPIRYQEISYYSAPKTRQKLNNLDAIDLQLFSTFEKLGIPLIKKKDSLSKIAIDAIFDSVSVATTFKEELMQEGVYFLPISEALHKYPDLVEKYFGSAISLTDNFFASLNSAVFSDGSFCYVSKNVICPVELSTYFRINDGNSGQFERTLLIADKSSYVSYIEGCTAPQYDKNQLHAAVVELIALEKAEIKYSTVQNWYTGGIDGKGGIYNFVTKRGVCAGKDSKISWTQVETGSSLTWKYPGCLLVGENGIGEFFSVALTNNYQLADTGTKMIHTGKNTRSHIVSKGISAGNSENSYRGLVKIGPDASQARSFAQCDSLLVGCNSQANTFPNIQVFNSGSNIEHEASTSKIGEEQIFYFMQRGISPEDAISLIVSGFCVEVFNTLPMEFALEANKLIDFKFEGGIG
uniref:Fe-S cluster assembly protein SufB n=1 Tax=Gloeochaete wittrockiana TaxID=38269 RepID=A0A3G1IVS6_9EUKA|nr:Fe-S cluster assembly protein SufB [Gloeochaete wittrockiana]YP_009546097.1 Fe-S cluster assembly protein SufB [Gloeochaete wittrockiana]ASQ40139.1 Fe-S cluster assembly protein SufB [Gloeochaete wittrockiana]ASQ40158.1 Fe-S cluster assembly protein SufB [Gloeochaete wittrockiana]